MVLYTSCIVPCPCLLTHIAPVYLLPYVLGMGTYSPVYCLYVYTMCSVFLHRPLLWCCILPVDHDEASLLCLLMCLMCVHVEPESRSECSSFHPDCKRSESIMFFCAVNSEIFTVNIPGMHFYSLFLYYYPRDAILCLIYDH